LGIESKRNPLAGLGFDIGDARVVMFSPWWQCRGTPFSSPRPCCSPGVKTLTLLGGNDATDIVTSLEALLLGRFGCVDDVVVRYGWWRCCSATLSFSSNDQVLGFGSAWVNPWRAARPRKVSSWCECWDYVPALVLGLVLAVCSTQGECFN
jgi:hypothetical protein